MTTKGKGKTIKVGVVGLGIGRLHLDGYRQSPQAQIVAVCDVSEKRAQEIAQQYGIPEVYTDYRRMLRRSDLDAVSVCTPNYLHATITIAALKAGKHVICEKPLATNPREGARMVAAAREAKKLLMVALNNRFRGDTQTLKRFIEAGELGEVYYAKTAWLRRSGIPRGWFRHKRESGGGPLIDLGVHMLDLTWWLMGCPKPVAVTGATYDKLYGSQPDFDVEDLAAAMVRFEGGQTLFVEVSWASHLEREQSGAQLFGTRGGATIDPLRIFRNLHDTPVDITPGFPQVSGHLVEIRHFVDCVANGEQCLAPAVQGLQVTKMLDAIYRSAASGKEVRL